MANPIRGYLNQVFEEGNSPTEQDRPKQGFVLQVFKMRVPCEGHEDVRCGEQQDGFQQRGHILLAIGHCTLSSVAAKDAAGGFRPAVASRCGHRGADRMAFHNSFLQCRVNRFEHASKQALRCAESGG